MIIIYTYILDTFIKPICLPFVKEYGVGNQLDETIFVSERHRNDFRVFGMVAGWGKVVNEGIYI